MTNILRAIGLFALLLLAGPAFAQSGGVVLAVCGTNVPGSYPVGSIGQPITMDPSGGLCLSSTGGILVGTAGAPAADVLTVQSPITLGSAGFPAASTPVSSSSGNVAAAVATATLAANATKTTYICGFSMTSAGSTAAAVVSPTVTGVIGGTMTYTYTTVAGATLANAPLIVQFDPCVPGSAINTAIVTSLPSLGAGNTNATVSAWGFQQ